MVSRHTRPHGAHVADAVSFEKKEPKTFVSDAPPNAALSTGVILNEFERPLDPGLVAAGTGPGATAPLVLHSEQNEEKIFTSARVPDAPLARPTFEHGSAANVPSGNAVLSKGPIDPGLDRRWDAPGAVPPIVAAGTVMTDTAQAEPTVGGYVVTSAPLTVEVGLHVNTPVVADATAPAAAGTYVEGVSMPFPRRLELTPNAVESPRVGSIVSVFSSFLDGAEQEVWHNMPAIVTRIHEGGLIDATVFPPGEPSSFRNNIEYGLEPGNWYWPEQLDAVLRLRQLDALRA